MIPLSINNKHLYKIALTQSQINGWVTTLGKAEANWTTDDIIQVSLGEGLFPSDIRLTAETYSSNAERTADYELTTLKLKNRKVKLEYTWNYMKADYLSKLLAECQYKYAFSKTVEGAIIEEDAPTITITYPDFSYGSQGNRSISTYLGQTIEGEIVEYTDTKSTSHIYTPTLYWKDLRLSFIER